MTPNRENANFHTDWFQFYYAIIFGNCWNPLSKRKKKFISSTGDTVSKLWTLLAFTTRAQSSFLFCHNSTGQAHWHRSPLKASPLFTLQRLSQNMHSGLCWQALHPITSSTLSLVSVSAPFTSRAFAAPTWPPAAAHNNAVRFCAWITPHFHTAQGQKTSCNVHVNTSKEWHQVVYWIHSLIVSHWKFYGTGGWDELKSCKGTQQLQCLQRSCVLSSTPASFHVPYRPILVVGIN